jgi:type IX secretion system PorP/SprF family membrane protein
MMKFAALFFAVVLTAPLCHGQYFQFSQYSFTNQRINPAIIASSGFAEVSFINRNQSTGGGFHLNSNFINASYPFNSRKSERRSGIGISFMDDRAGQTGLFSTQEAGLSYAVSIPLATGTSVSLGLKAVHSRRKVDLSGLSTGLQFVPDRGFDETASSGEDQGKLDNAFNTFSAGIFWRKEDKKNNTLASAGISFFDFNRPDESLLESPASYSSTLVGSVSYLMYRLEKVSVSPGLMATLSANRITFNAGVVTSYELQSYRNKPSDHIDFITGYRSHEGPLLGIQFHKGNLGVGLSYDFPLWGQNVSNNGSIEFGLSLKKLVAPQKARRKKSSAVKKPAVSPVKTVAKKTPTAKDSTSTTPDRAHPPATLTEKLRTKQDSLRAIAVPGEISHEPLILEKAVLHFNFNFNSTELDEEATAYLDEVATALIDNPELAIELTGHTDNVGSAKFNLKLSALRANVIRDYLVSQGVNESRIVAQGKGMTEPLNQNKSEDEKAANRRVEMKILYAQ